MTVSAHNAWAWGGANDGVKSTAACLEMLIRGAGGDGNVLLNVGPRPDGVIDPAQANLLKEIGEWLAKNGESIYGTRGGPWKPTQCHRQHTQGQHDLSARDEDGRWPRRIARAAGGNQIRQSTQRREGRFSQKDGKLIVEIPAADVEPVDTIVKLDLDRPAMDLPALRRLRRQSHGVERLSGHDAEYGPQQAFDNDPANALGDGFAAPSRRGLPPTLADPSSFAGCASRKPLGRAGQKFEFQYRDGAEWKTIFTGDRIGEWFAKKLDEAVTAREFRLNILDATDGPTINDIELLEN